MNKTTAQGSSSGAFVDKAEGVPGTKLTAADMNAHQNELYNAIVGGGQTPNAGNESQLLAAIRNIAVPVGFIYTQLPGMDAPATLWPWATWANVSSTFAGAFFRAEGGKAASFGAGEQADAMQGHWHNLYDGTNQYAGLGKSGTGGSNMSFFNGAPVPPGIHKVSDPQTDGVNGTPRTSDETRPTNFTVRVWKRTA